MRKAEAARNVKRLKPGAKAYDPRGETPPDHRFFKLNKANIELEIRDIVNQILSRLISARAEDKELSSMKKAASEAREVADSDGETVAMVGQQGMGKSLLINALQNRRNLSKTSAKGKACTASAIKYCSKPGAGEFDEIYDAVVTFMDDAYLNEIIQEHIRRFDHFHFSDNVDPLYHDEEKRSAATAKEFFYLVFNADNNDAAKSQLEILLTAPNIRNGSLLNATIKMAHDRIVEARAGEDRKIAFLNMKIEPLMADIESYMAQQEEYPALWVIVQDVSICLGSALTANRVFMVDLPGKSYHCI
jgi:hypothetical protein